MLACCCAGCLWCGACSAVAGAAVAASLQVQAEVALFAEVPGPPTTKQWCAAAAGATTPHCKAGWETVGEQYTHLPRSCWVQTLVRVQGSLHSGRPEAREPHKEPSSPSRRTDLNSRCPNTPGLHSALAENTPQAPAGTSPTSFSPPQPPPTPSHADGVACAPRPAQACHVCPPKQASQQAHGPASRFHNHPGASYSLPTTSDCSASSRTP